MGDEKQIMIDGIKYLRPSDVPPNLTPLERAKTAAANIRIWADWLLQEGPAPKKSDVLTDASKETPE